MTDGPTTTVVIPTYNEVENIGPILRAVRGVVPEATIVIVDDSSPDGTADAARAIGEEIGGVVVLSRTTKDGLGGAYRLGMRWALDHGAQVCVQMDADGSHDPTVLPALVANVAHGADVAIGSRYVPGGQTVDWPPLRRALSRWGNRYAGGVLGLAINDATAGYRAWSAAALERIAFDDVSANGYGFQVEMTHRLVAAGGKVVEFPIVFRDRTRGTSKMSTAIIGEALRLVLRLRLADARSRRQRRRDGR